MNNINRATIVERVFATFLDSIILMLIYLSIGVFINLCGLNKGIELIAFPVFYLMFLFKDVNGLSLGKRIAGLKIVRRRNSSSPKWYETVVRNLFLNINIVEMAIMLIDKNHERLGDKITKTIVIKSRA